MRRCGVAVTPFSIDKKTKKKYIPRQSGQGLRNRLPYTTMSVYLPLSTLQSEQRIQGLRHADCLEIYISRWHCHCGQW